MKEGFGWVASADPRATEATTYYTAFDVTSYGATSTIPRVYKKITMTPIYDTLGVGSNSRIVPRNKVTEVIKTFSLHTVIITLDKGVVSGISYDDGCFFCPSNGPLCEANAFNATPGGYSSVGGTYIGCANAMDSCYPTLGASTVIDAMTLNLTTIPETSILTNFTYKNCVNDTDPSTCTTRTIVGANTTIVPAVNVSTWAYPPSNTTAPAAVSKNSTLTAAELNSAAETCDLKIFVVWTGTDSTGQYLKSANRRFSRFRQFSVSTAYQSALNLGQNAIDVGKTAISVAESIPGAVSRDE
jgi:hypothetical protein